MTEPIEDLYFDWLCAKVLEERTRSYRRLLGVMYRTEFVWVVPADKHRVADGIELRNVFLKETNVQMTDLPWNQPCSIFEMLVAFSGRASFQTDMPEKDWFWIFMSNLKLDKVRRVTSGTMRKIEEILYTFVWRIYEPNGLGGLFPMNRTEKDQREVELWYQLHEWIDEQGLV